MAARTTSCAISKLGNRTLNYRGSIVSLYYNYQATGTYKCCDNVYGRQPARTASMPTS